MILIIQLSQFIILEIQLSQEMILLIQLSQFIILEIQLSQLSIMFCVQVVVQWENIFQLSQNFTWT